VVLESQAAGCPVISTDPCALPETNNNEIGWLINVPKNQLGVAEMHTEKQRAKLSSIIQENLYAIIRGICSDPGIIREKGIRCIEKIRIECSPGDRAEALEQIYRGILESA
jgi:glycosyltransferase involved in cell wall biosynthesis